MLKEFNTEVRSRVLEGEKVMSTQLRAGNNTPGRRRVQALNKSRFLCLGGVRTSQQNKYFCVIILERA